MFIFLVYLNESKVIVMYKLMASYIAQHIINKNLV